MSTYLGTQLLAGVATDTISNANSLLDFKWTDHILNELSWLRADTFSWQSGDVYVAAYNHLVADASGTAQTETIGSYTITYYRANDGHKIVLADQEQTVINIYNESGVAWYYILDTTNTRFKLPRTKFGFTGIRGQVGNYVPETLPNISGGIRAVGAEMASAYGVFAVGGGAATVYNASYGSNDGFTFDASRVTSVYQNGASVQQKATQMYLYFYVGDYDVADVNGVAVANVDLSNLSSTGKNISNWSSNVSNCITYIPQDIKLELNNSTLKLKAGSKVYVPNGVGVFDVVTIASDITVSIAQEANQYMIVYNKTTSDVWFANLNGQASGTSPSGTGFYYNISTNKVVYVRSGVADAYEFSLPIGIVTSDATKYTSIDQVFNGFGYIGSTVFALPGVKGLIPNGRNEDGTLKSIEFTTSSVLLNNGLSGDVIEYGIIDGNEFHVYNASLSGIQSGKVWYEEKENKLYVGTSPSNHCMCIIISANGQTITRFNPKPTLRVLDYNDKGTIAGWAMPSDSYTDLTIGASGTNYTAPSNGYFCAGGYSDTLGGYFQITTANRIDFTFQGWGTQHWGRGLIPVKKGALIVLLYSAFTFEYFKFIPAEGEQ